MKSIKKFIREMIPVLLGVLIALYINNWNEDRKDKVYINNFYISLKKELAETDKEIMEKTPNQQMLVDTLNRYANDETTTLIDVIGRGGGVDGPMIKLNYWKALSRSKVELIDYKKLSILSDLEEGNELLKYKRNKLLDYVFLNLTETGKKEKMIVKLMMEEMMRTQWMIQNDIQVLLNDGE